MFTSSPSSFRPPSSPALIRPYILLAMSTAPNVTAVYSVGPLRTPTSLLSVYSRHLLLEYQFKFEKSPELWKSDLKHCCNSVARRTTLHTSSFDSLPSMVSLNSISTNCARWKMEFQPQTPRYASTPVPSIPYPLLCPFHEPSAPR